jgi:hypothetical protein
LQVVAEVLLVEAVQVDFFKAAQLLAQGKQIQ